MEHVAITYSLEGRKFVANIAPKKSGLSIVPVVTDMPTEVAEGVIADVVAELQQNSAEPQVAA